MKYPLFNLILLVSFLHGVFASGFIPILHDKLGDEASWPFALYFVGLLLGQLLIYWVGRLSQHRALFAVYEILFGASLIYMGFFDGRWVLTFGRGWEGIAAGLATPLLFTHLIMAPNSIENKTKIVRYNAVFALGYVLGPVFVKLTLLRFEIQVFLLFSGLLFMAINASLIPMLPHFEPVPEEDLKLSKLFGNISWFDKFYSLFYGKCFYGFLLTFLTSYATVYFSWHLWKLDTVTLLTLILAFIFAGGQQVGAKTIRFFNPRGLEIVIPLSMCVTLLLFFTVKWGPLLLVAAVLQAYLLFIAFLNFTEKIRSGREFALFNSLSDPGMVIGAVCAGFGLKGALVVAALGVLPLLYWRHLPPVLKENTPVTETQQAG